MRGSVLLAPNPTYMRGCVMKGKIKYADPSTVATPLVIQEQAKAPS